jgi:hypothetical protein
MTPEELTDFALGLESGVWQALMDGDPDVDRALLSEDFLGVYPTGFANRDEHAEQLRDGPTVVEYQIHSPLAVAVADDLIQFAYDARYRRTTGGDLDRMYVMSLWAKRDGAWVNTFSQDTPAAD